jgi:PAS domain S-box-containing protein
MNVRGEPVLAAARSIKDSPWIVVAMVNPVQLGGPLRERVWAVALLVAVVLFGVGAALSLVWRQQRAGLLRDQLKVAEALRASEGRFRQVLETISLIGVMLDAKGNIVLINDYLLRLTGWRAEELRERNWFETFLPPEIRTEIEERIFLRLIQDGVDPMHFENEILTRSGERRLVAWNNTVLRDGAGVVTGVASIGEDITDRRQAEGKLLASLREKEALLKEVHHRVKNNLQIVASLLRLESGRSEHLMTKYVLQEMHGRIRAMALLHESLYRNAKFERIDLAAYLRQLVAYLGRSLGSATGAIQFDLKFDAVEVGADEAIPCGLIINELVTNSVKHGFPNGGTGVVTIELQHAALPGEVQLCVRDNGVGLPAGFDPTTVKSLGMQLVADLARQLGGRLAVGPGPMFTVAFRAAPLGSIQVKAAAGTKIHG